MGFANARMTETTVLAETNRRHVQAVVGSFSTAIFRSLPDGEPDFWCTGILLRFGDILVLVTAAHCLDT